MRIGVDIMGGDNAPDAAILGAIQARKELPAQVDIVLIGDSGQVDNILSREGYDPGGFSILHTRDTIGMEDHPAKVYSQKPDSGIAVGLKMLRSREIDGFASTGNTGALLVGAIQIINVIPGVIRPCITASVPNDKGNPTILLDVGLNPDCRPDVLYQYAIFGSIYSKLTYGVQTPRVGLLNIGQEEEKGNLLTKATFQAMKDTKDFNFIGNVEGNDFFRDGRADVVVCDGFVGNVMIKEMEAFYSMMQGRGISDDFLENFNFEQHGGTPVLGIHKPLIIGHGRSNEKAIRTMILQTRDVIESDLIGKIKEIFQ